MVLFQLHLLIIAIFLRNFQILLEKYIKTWYNIDV